MTLVDLSPHHPRRSRHLPRPPGARHPRSPVARGLAAILRAGDRVPHRPDRDGREHRHVPRHAVAPVRRGKPDLAGLPLEAAREPRGRSCSAAALGGRGIDATALGSARRARQGGPRADRVGPVSSGRPPTGRDIRSSRATRRSGSRDGGAALVGIDSLNVDDTADGARPVHTTLLDAGILDRGAPHEPGRPPRRRLPLLRCPVRVYAGWGRSRCGRSRSWADSAARLR